MTCHWRSSDPFPPVGLGAGEPVDQWPEATGSNGGGNDQRKTTWKQSLQSFSIFVAFLKIINPV